MFIPRYWAENTITFPHKNKIATIKRYGWSNENQNNAKHHAIERCDTAKQTLQSGKAVKRIEGKDNYLDTWGLPIREQIVQEYPHIDSVTTINNYGALCLNVADVIVLDCDNDSLISHAQRQFNIAKPKTANIGWQLFLIVILVIVSTYVANKFLDNKALIIALFFLFWLVWGVLVTLIFEKWENYQINKWLAKYGGYSGLLDKFLADFITVYPDFAFHVYQTPNGFRLIEANHLTTPNSNLATLCFEQLPVDSNYTHLCKIQKCYRARVTGKPWRMGMEKIPFRYFWQADKPDFTQRTQWLEQYQQKIGNFSACRFVKIIGYSQHFQSKIQAFIELHDDLCQAKTDFPLA